MKEFVLNRYISDAEYILTDAKAAFEKLELPVENLPQNMQPEEGPLKLVFVGQYSAGKSSIIKMLSGIDTGIGAKIVTNEAREFDWNGLTIVDTPGIQTGVHEDHDAITYDEIGQAALLIFVITNEGFDRVIGKHFQQLAVEQNRGNNMILVVNKMDRCEEGNTEEQQKVIAEDIQKVIAPYSPQDLYVSFISTSDYEEALNEEDEEIKQELLEESGYESFISHLNSFVASKNISAKIETPLIKLQTAIKKVGVGIDVAGLADSKAEITRREKQVYVNAQEDILRDAKEAIRLARSNMEAEGRLAAGCIEEAAEEETIKKNLEEHAKQAQAYSESCVEEINAILQKKLDSMGQEIESLHQSELVKAFEVQIESLGIAEGEETTMDKIFSGGKKYGDAWLQSSLKGTKVAGKNLFGTLLSESKDFKGGDLQKALYRFGKTFNFEFLDTAKTVKIASGISKALVVLQVGLMAKETYDNLIKKPKEEQKKEETILQVRQDIELQFRKQAEEFYDTAISQVKAEIETIFQPLVTDCNKTLQEIEDSRELFKQRAKALDEILERTQKLMREIENA